MLITCFAKKVSNYYYLTLSVYSKVEIKINSTFAANELFRAEQMHIHFYFFVFIYLLQIRIEICEIIHSDFCLKFIEISLRKKE